MEIDFASGNEKWKIEKALELVYAYAAGYVAHGGLHGGLHSAAVADLFKNSYKALSQIEEMVKKDEHKK